MNGEVKELLHQVLEKLNGIEARLDALEQHTSKIETRTEEQMEFIKHDLSLCVMSLGANNIL